MTENVCCSSCKVPFVPVRFQLNANIRNRFSENTPTSNFMKILPVRAELFHEEGRTDMTKRTVAFHNFVNAPKKKDGYLKIFK
jgi:hypothetical protein